MGFNLEKNINSLRKSRFFGAVFHTLDYCLQKELEDCESVLDLGCGPSSPLKNCKNVKYSIGIEAFIPYLKESQERQIHSEYINKKIEEVDFQENSFDAIIMTEVLEHMSKGAGEELLRKAEKWAKKKIVLSTPNGYFPMDGVDENIYQKHLSGWSIEDLKTIGYKVKGLSGAKIMYSGKNNVQELKQKNALFSNIRFRPRTVFYLINAGLQIFTYFLPKFSFGLFAVKKLNKQHD